MNGLTLPEGRRGQALAAGLGLVTLLGLWLGLLGPVLGWYQARQDELVQQRALAAHKQALAQAMPALQTALAHATPSAQSAALLAGNSDAIAGANLQSLLTDLAIQAGTSLDSAALVPAQPLGGLRQIGLRVSLTASWPAFVGLLTAVETTSPRLVVDGLTLTGAPAADGSATQLQAGFTVSAFRAAEGG